MNGAGMGASYIGTVVGTYLAGFVVGISVGALGVGTMYSIGSFGLVHH